MYRLQYRQKLPLSLKESWEFFSRPENLKDLTPSYLGFEISHDLEGKRMYAGQIICYIIRPLFHLPFEWITEITEVQEPYYFIDEQRLGPYKFWHHEHHFKELARGTEMIDLIYYKMPFGIFGKVLHAVKVKKDLQKIFTYRRHYLEKRFGKYAS